MPLRRFYCARFAADYLPLLPRAAITPADALMPMMPASPPRHRCHYAASYVFDAISLPFADDFAAVTSSPCFRCFESASAA